MTERTIAEVAQGPWKLPEGWKWKPLREVVTVHDGPRKPVKKTERSLGDIPYCGANGIVDSVAGFTHDGDYVLLAEDGGFYGPGRPSAYRIVGKFWANNHVHMLKGKNDVLDNGWLLYVFMTLDLRSYLTGATRPKLTQGYMQRILLPVPPSLETQRRIVARIESLLAEVKEARTLLEEMRRDAGRMMDAALEEMTNRLPEYRRPLSEVLKSKPKNGWSPKCDNDPAGTPVLKLGAVLGFNYSPDEVKRTSVPVDPKADYWLQPGDVLISRSNTLELVGQASIYSGTPYPCIYPDLLMRLRIRDSEADKDFLIYWLRANQTRKFVKSRASGASSTMKKIKQDDVCSIPFPTINLEEQRRWASRLDAVQSEVDRMRSVLDEEERLLGRLERSILERAFRGEL